MTPARVWQVFALGSGAASGAATRAALTRVWRRAGRGDPPRNPVAPDVSWFGALGWAVSVGVGTGILRVATLRLAAAGWERVTGKPPPGAQRDGERQPRHSSAS